MKKIFTIILILSVFVILPSCTDFYLDIKPLQKKKCSASSWQLKGVRCNDGTEFVDSQTSSWNQTSCDDHGGIDVYLCRNY